MGLLESFLVDVQRSADRSVHMEAGVVLAKRYDESILIFRKIGKQNNANEVYESHGSAIM